MATHRAASSSEPYFGDRLTKQLILVLRGAPAAADVELDAVVSGIRRRFAQGLEQIGVEVGYAGILVIKHGHAVGEETILLGNGTVSLGSRATVVAAKGFGECGRRIPTTVTAASHSDERGRQMTMLTGRRRFR